MTLASAGGAWASVVVNDGFETIGGAATPNSISVSWDGAPIYSATNSPVSPRASLAQGISTALPSGACVSGMLLAATL